MTPSGSPVTITVGPVKVTAKATACCGNVRVEGWITAPNREAGSRADLLIARRLGLTPRHPQTPPSLCSYWHPDTANQSPASAPFAFDLPLLEYPRSETMDEAIARVTRDLRRAMREPRGST